GVVAGPHLVRPAQHTQVGAAATTRARFDAQRWELSAQLTPYVVQPEHVANPHFALLAWLLRPAYRRPGAIVVPLDELDRAMLSQQRTQLGEDGRADVRP